MIIKNINQVIKEEVNYINNIRNGTFAPIDTGFKFINNTSLNGLHISDIITIAGLSGTGKTSFAGQLETNIINNNNNIRILNLTFEMPARKLLSRKLSSDLKIKLNEIYNKENNLNLKYYLKYKDLPIDYSENPLNVEKLNDLLVEYNKKYINEIKIIILDHTLLVENLLGDSERITLINIGKLFNKLKKKGKFIFIILSQLNDSMLKPERRVNSLNHYPQMTDLFGGRAIYHISDLVYILSNPIALNIKGSYGIHNFPLYLRTNKNPSGYPLLFMHAIKARDGVNLITPLINKLEHNKLIELPTKYLKEYLKLTKYKFT